MPEVGLRAKLGAVLPHLHPGPPEDDGLSRTEVIAHRGLPREYPENTLPGFEAALAAGADGLELDVHATSDDVVVVHHDPDLPAPGDGGRRPIRFLTWTELASLPAGRTVPRLADVLDLVAARATVYVEVKARGIEHLLVPLVASRADWCAVHSFDHRVVAALRRTVPNVRTGVLMSSYLMDPLAPLRDTGAHDLWQHAAQLDEALVRAATSHGARVIAWTVNDRDLARQFTTWGVAGICTDVTRKMVSVARQ